MVTVSTVGDPGPAAFQKKSSGDYRYGHKRLLWSSSVVEYVGSKWDKLSFLNLLYGHLNVTWGKLLVIPDLNAWREALNDSIYTTRSFKWNYYETQATKRVIFQIRMVQSRPNPVSRPQTCPTSLERLTQIKSHFNLRSRLQADLFQLHGLFFDDMRVNLRLMLNRKKKSSWQL